MSSSPMAEYLCSRFVLFSLSPPLPLSQVTRFLCTSPLPNSSQTFLRTPPRKAKQAVRRFLKLLSVSRKEAPVVAALQTLQNSPQNLSSSEAALLGFVYTIHRLCDSMCKIQHLRVLECCYVIHCTLDLLSGGLCVCLSYSRDHYSS